MESHEQEPTLPAGLVVFSADGRAEFGWLNPETEQYFSEATGEVIRDAVGAVPWAANRTH
ncbi:hypothetical protein DIE23_29855 [Burkholderia sp. Bp9143]|uniref:hypothetical protein n=1 Tax=Burkholderia sp. Bp9143 TaxID=2184574 RepID=UPI000F5964DC|nr:hypothetical protein [Burkholderia sp. Bp9143]RQR26309.1 hypothetical protein DIE23_29855 [Burkholderia sp. Bp9143]